MLKRVFYISIMFMSLHLEAQNIVPNGGFEEITNCPTGGQKYFWHPHGGHLKVVQTCIMNAVVLDIRFLLTRMVHKCHIKVKAMLVLQLTSITLHLLMRGSF